MKHRVVITGMGIVCPLGHSVPKMWEGLMTGQSGAAPTTLFDASTFPTTFGAEVKNFDLSQFVKNNLLIIKYLDTISLAVLEIIKFSFFNYFDIIKL